MGRAIREGHNLFVTALLNGQDRLKQMRENLSGIAPGDFDPQFPSWLRSAA